MKLGCDVNGTHTHTHNMLMTLSFHFIRFFFVHLLEYAEAIIKSFSRSCNWLLIHRALSFVALHNADRVWPLVVCVLAYIVDVDMRCGPFDPLA